MADSRVPLVNTASQFVNIDPSQYALPTQGDLDKYLQDAFNKLKPYYDKLLSEAKGDFTEASRRLEYDYQTGSRYNVEDTTMNTQRQQEDLASAMKTLGLTFKGETENKIDALNKRGIALTQDPLTGRAGLPEATPISYDSSGNPVYQGTGGRSGSELSMLSEDQRLRREAEQRTAQRNMQDIGIKSSRTQEGLSQTLQRGQYDTGRDYQTKLEGLQQQKEQQATGMASAAEQRDLQAKQLAALQAQQAAGFSAFGGSSGGGGGDLSVDQIKSMYPKYRPWNDAASIMADYKAGHANG